MSTLVNSQPAVEAGYISKEWVRHNILKISDEEWEEIQDHQEEEKEKELADKKKEQDTLNPPDEQDDQDQSPFGHFQLTPVKDKDGDDDVPKGKVPPKKGKGKKPPVKESLIIQLAEEINAMMAERALLDKEQNELTVEKVELEDLKESVQTLVDALKDEETK
jgi:hypothetical protein